MFRGGNYRHIAASKAAPSMYKSCMSLRTATQHKLRLWTDCTTMIEIN